MQLALECLRAGDDYDASSALFAGAHEETCSAIRLAFLDAGFSTPNRVLCARLALALRVLLRADAGDFARRVVCPECGSRLPDHYKGGERIVCDENDVERSAFRTCRVRPLWESAPEHRSE